MRVGPSLDRAKARPPPALEVPPTCPPIATQPPCPPRNQPPCNPPNTQPHFAAQSPPGNPTLRLRVWLEKGRARPGSGQERQPQQHRPGSLHAQESLERRPAKKTRPTQLQPQQRSLLASLTVLFGPALAHRVDCSLPASAPTSLPPTAVLLEKETKRLERNEAREIRAPNLLIWSQTRCRCAIAPMRDYASSKWHDDYKRSTKANLRLNGRMNGEWINQLATTPAKPTHT